MKNGLIVTLFFPRTNVTIIAISHIFQITYFILFRRLTDRHYGERKETAYPTIFTYAVSLYSRNSPLNNYDTDK